MAGEMYLGDGLYVSIEGPYVKLRAPRSDGDHEVYMELEVIDEFIRFLKHKGILTFAQASLPTRSKDHT